MFKGSQCTLKVSIANFGIRFKILTLYFFQKSDLPKYFLRRKWAYRQFTFIKIPFLWGEWQLCQWPSVWRDELSRFRSEICQLCMDRNNAYQPRIHSSYCKYHSWHASSNPVSQPKNLQCKYSEFKLSRNNSIIKCYLHENYRIWSLFRIENSFKLANWTVP